MHRKLFGKSTVVLLALALLVSLAAPAMGYPSATPAGDKLEVLVGFQGEPNPGLVRAFGGDIYRNFKHLDVVAAKMAPQAIDALRRHPAVRYIEADEEVHALGQLVPWGVDRVFGAEDYVFPTWDDSTGAGIGVAVLDTGIDRNHEDLHVAGGTNRLTGTDDFADGEGHGTHVAGTIAALANTTGVVGVAPDADIYAVKVLNDSGSGTWSSVAAGIDWVIEQNTTGQIIHIINMSLGGSTDSQTLRDACDRAYATGILLVAAAGNEGNPSGKGDKVGYPAKYSSVIAVAASDQSDKRASFSSTGPAVELIAPGVSILSTYPSNTLKYASGTSMASPHVAGAAALVWAANPGLTNVQVRDILKLKAEDLGLLPTQQGNGLVRADLAVDAAGGTTPEPDPLYSVSGIVVKASGGTPLPGATISINGDIATTTGADGSYSVSGFAAGSYEISASLDGYATSTKTFTVPGEAVVDFALSALTPPNPVTVLAVSVSTDKTVYAARTWVNITAAVTAEGTPVSGAAVTATVTYPDGSTASMLTGTTDAAGNAYLAYRVPNKAPGGTYHIEVTAEKDGLSDTASASFRVN